MDSQLLPYRLEDAVELLERVITNQYFLFNEDGEWFCNYCGNTHPDDTDFPHQLDCIFLEIGDFVKDNS